MRRVRRRGLTLIEMIVTVAVASVVIAAVIASGVTMVQFTQGQGRRTAAETQLALALSQIERRASNAGVNFANAKYAVRFHNNVPSGTLLNYDGNTTPVVARCGVPPCAGAPAGIVEGTDVLELAMSPSGVRRMGNALQPRGPGGSTTVQLGTGDPFLDSELDPAGPKGQVVLFSDPRFPEDSCLARLEATALGSNTPTFNFADDNLAPNTTETCASPSVPPGRPGEGQACPCRGDSFDVFVLEQRVRFVIYQQANGLDMGLYLQEPGGLPGTFGNVFTPVALGIENLQVAPTVGARLDGSDLIVEGCTATGLTAGLPNWNPCRCNDSLAAACTLGDTAVPGDAEAFVRSLAVELTARADRREDGRLPESFDSPEGPVDRVDRMRASTDIRIANPFLPLR